jgi:hypothetical protein
VSEQPEALRLAEDLEYCASRELYRYMGLDEAAAELRRLHAVNAELLEALDTLTAVVGLTPVAGNKVALQEAFDLARAAIARAEEVKP